MKTLLRTKLAVAGFTLIEIMITVAVIAIIAAVALPSYFDYVTRSRLVEARANLADMRTRMEQFFLDNRTYPATCVAATATPDGRRKSGCRETPSSSAIRARRSGRNHVHDHRDRHVQLRHPLHLHRQRSQRPPDNVGSRRAGTRPPDCWITRKSGDADVRLRAEMRGFTLIELMVAIAIAALLLLLAGPSFTTFLRNSEIRSTSESIVNGLRAAKTEAARQNRRVMFSLAGGNSASWAINLVNDPVDCADPVAPPIQSYAKEEAGKNSKVTITPANKLTVCFDGVGRVVNQGDSERPHHVDRYRIHRRLRGQALAYRRRRRRQAYTARAPDVRSQPESPCRRSQVLQRWQ